jgi:hypothetical protein
MELIHRPRTDELTETDAVDEMMFVRRINVPLTNCRLSLLEWNYSLIHI